MSKFKFLHCLIRNQTEQTRQDTQVCTIYVHDSFTWYSFVVTVQTAKGTGDVPIVAIIGNSCGCVLDFVDSPASRNRKWLANDPSETHEIVVLFILPYCIHQHCYGFLENLSYNMFETEIVGIQTNSKSNSH